MSSLRTSAGSSGSSTRAGEAGSRASASEQRRTEILDAALALFDTVGYDATSIEHIRERSGASIGSIYHHFKSKEGIAAALYVRGLEQYRAELLAGVRRARTARTLVRGIVLHHLRWAAANPGLTRFLLHMRRTESVQAIEGELRASTAAFVREVWLHLSPYVERGEIVRVPPALYPALLVGPAQDLLRHWVSGRSDLDPLAAAETLADAAWRSVRPDDRDG